MTKLSLRLVLLVAAGACPISLASAQERWSVEIEPYVWIPDLSGEGSAGGRRRIANSG